MKELLELRKEMHQMTGIPPITRLLKVFLRREKVWEKEWIPIKTSYL
ncbi:hypothetical protein [Fonticella tunisiensis]|nr:hypothetical protein [Fonticella tunisiensis]